MTMDSAGGRGFLDTRKRVAIVNWLVASAVILKMEKAGEYKLSTNLKARLETWDVAVPNVSVTYYLMCAMVTKPLNAPVCTLVDVKFSPAH